MREGGYVIALTALLLLPLLAFTGLAVDLGAWFGRAAEMQKASDAAALAGVVFLPDTGRADAAAREVAAANGFPAGDGISITVTPVSGSNARLRVTISDDAADQYFTSMFTGGAVDITRTSTAEYIKPVPMGSPKNFLGTGDTLSGGNREDFWLAVSGGCASKEQGDRIQAQTDANFTSWRNPPEGSGWAGCTGGNTIPNANYDADGYFYAVEFPEDRSGSVDIEVYDGPYCGGGGAGDSTGAFDTTFTIRDNSSYDPRNTRVLDVIELQPDDCDGRSGWSGGWRRLATLNNPTKGTYFVQVQSETQAQAGSQSQMGSNSFGLRANPGGGQFEICTSVSGESGYRADCPNVYGVNHMGVLADLGSTVPSFYLADIGPEHNGKQMEISLWDPGEGSRRLEILDPNGDPVDFEWQVMCQNGEPGPCSGETAPTGGYGPRVDDELDLGRSDERYPQPGPYRLSTSKYSDRLLRLTVDLPDDIDEAYGGRTWWRIRYTVGSAPTDRTTWSVVVKGDPVRLVPNT